MRPGVLRVVLAAVALATPGRVVASEAPPGPSLQLEWSAPATCPGADVVREMASALLGAPVVANGTASTQVRARVQASAGVFVLTIETRSRGGTDRRRLQDPRCSVLAEAAALIAAAAAGAGDLAPGSVSVPPVPGDLSPGTGVSVPPVPGDLSPGTGVSVPPVPGDLSPGTGVSVPPPMGVPVGYPGNPLVFADGDADEQANFGVGPGCASADAFAVPPGRIREVVEQTAPLGPGLFSICAPSFDSSLASLADGLLEK